MNQYRPYIIRLNCYCQFTVLWTNSDYFNKYDSIYNYNNRKNNKACILKRYRRCPWYNIIECICTCICINSASMSTALQQDIIYISRMRGHSLWAIYITPSDETSFFYLDTKNTSHVDRPTDEIDIV
jgi:hypothetical protein